MDNIKINIEGHLYEVPSDLTILEAARKVGYNIPSLCYWNKGHNSLASCRVCLVELASSRGSRLVASCVYPVSECAADKGFVIKISSPMAIDARRTSVELLLSNHSKDCQTCVKNGQCELLHVASLTGARSGQFLGEVTPSTYDDVAPGLVRNTSKCILCGRCIERCKEAQGIGILGFEKRGFNTIVGPAENRSFASVPCIQCGQCIEVCPTGALSEKREIDKVDQAMHQGKYVIVQTAPAIRAAIAEEFGHKIGEQNGTGKMVAALHRLGFYRVFDTNFGADLTIMEEAQELLNRIKTGGTLPQITSCSPGWINYMEYFYSDLIPNVSTCKSPHEMEGAIIKSYFASKHGLKPEDIFVVSIMPCTAKKYEAKRPQNAAVNGLPDVDAVLTTRELAVMIKRAGLLWDELPEEEFDDDLIGEYTGAGAIFGVTGGVMEAALRTAYHTLTGKEYDKIEFLEVRGQKSLKEAEIDIAGTKLKVAIASGMKAAKPLLDEVREGKSPYAFIEIMGCPGGCINGGGQPFVKPNLIPNQGADILDRYRQLRANVLYSIDEKKTIRQSHNNPDIIRLYKDYLGSPCGGVAEELLHTSYNASREAFPSVKAK
ncbi:MAG TPA: iron hydrogenase small subunit [Candidatus Enteromonas pullicola]|uniref:Iron hydrogenase small subunit n=1 Tax=Candidatus Alloenteromonas pullicola TaxID=2840784 RepID=A0A9D1LND9_9FIRM|nr:iron hydrogenase small subunit [Candidatus Enteromonas pullicola]